MNPEEMIANEEAVSAPEGMVDCEIEESDTSICKNEIPALTLPSPYDDVTIREARLKLHAEMWHKGLLPTCPCCTQTANIYKWTIPTCLAEALVRIRQMHDANPLVEYFHVYNCLKKIPRLNPNSGSWGGEYAKLRFWGLLTPLIETGPDKNRRNGMWAITKLGRDFSLGLARVPRHIRLFNNTFYGFVDPEDKISIHEVKGFNYEDILDT